MPYVLLCISMRIYIYLYMYGINIGSATQFSCDPIGFFTQLVVSSSNEKSFFQHMAVWWRDLAEKMLCQDALTWAPEGD
jgi:hypothetical protein